MQQRATNTYEEWLNKTLQQVQAGKSVEDALSHIDFIESLETAVLAEIHKPVDQITGQQVDQSGAQGPPLSQVPVPPPGPVGPVAPGAAGPGGPPLGPGGPMPGIQMPNPDELRRVLGMSGQ